ncbi:hypothetical protein TNCT_147221 [Trichonephila clavata]|uniref:Uncharacterized protein n=1 Tax=Trichonephila clavata TaxID=2740835 RepID=A0A8X6I949_TRICU|nr:hypothetical protein TNCT_147221 [Trichonephila clavata]
MNGEKGLASPIYLSLPDPQTGVGEWKSVTSGSGACNEELEREIEKKAIFEKSVDKEHPLVSSAVPGRKRLHGGLPLRADHLLQDPEPYGKRVPWDLSCGYIGLSKKNNNEWASGID